MENKKKKLTVQFCQDAEFKCAEVKHTETSTTINTEDGEDCCCQNECYEINQPEGVSVLNEAYEYAKDFIILSKQNDMFKPFMKELREAYLKGFKYMKDGGDYCNIDFSFDNVFYDNLRDVGCGFWAAYKTFIKNAFDAGVNLYVRYSEGKIRISDIENVSDALATKGDELSCMELWAKDEIERICKKNNPDFDIFSDDFDYDGSCYKSAFKAYRSICNDEHSGMSYGFTKNILIKLLNQQPLTPIVDEDFFEEMDRPYPTESKDYLKECGLKSNLQCPRRSSLFRRETLDGKISYSDVDREYCFDIENPSNTYSGFGCKFVDEIFPITMPYHPSSKKYAVACREFLVDKSHGDFDTVEVLYIETHDGEKVEINRYFTDGRNVGFENDDHFKEITKEQYDELCKKRLDKVEDKIVDRLLWTLIDSKSSSYEENEFLGKRYNLLPDNIRTKIYSELKELVVKHIVEPQKFEYNTFNVRFALCEQNDYYKHELSKIEGLKEISEYLMSVYNLLKLEIKI